MPEAFNAAVLYRNLSDAGALTASSFSGSLDVSQLKDRHIGRKWRSEGNSASIVVDLLTAQAVDTFALIGTNLTTAATVRVRASSTDSSAQNGNVFDSGEQTGLVDPRYGQFAILSQLGSARYVRFDLADASLPFLQAGRLVVGQRHQYDTNFSYGWNYRRIDRSRRTESRGGQLFIDRDNSYRVIDVTFDMMSRDIRYGFVEDLDIANGRHEDVLFILNPTGNLSRDVIWGLVDSEDPISQPYFDRFFRYYSIRERL